MKIHYDPFSNPNDNESFSEYGYCGTYISDGNSAGDKDYVTCKKCIKKFKQADDELKRAKYSQYKQMEEFVNSMNLQNIIQ
jgi:hypothetical protein